MPARALYRMAALLCLPASAVLCQERPANEVLQQIRKRVAENQRHLPNYVCRQTVERFYRPQDGRRWMPLDTLRLDVALIDGRELYAWPGSSKFEEKGIAEVIGKTGAIGTGNFALHARSLFLKNNAEFTYAGEEEKNGRKAVRFNYRVARERSEFIISDNKNATFVAYEGSFWADAVTLDLIRLEVRANKIPEPVQVSKSADVMEYARVRIGEGDFLLPHSAEMVMTAADGENRNLTRLEGCRQYVGESVVSFTDAAPAVAAPKPVRAVRLPAALEIEMRLETAIARGKTAVGDTATAVLAKPVRDKDGSELLPKGAKFTGRFTRVEHQRAASLEYDIVGLTFETVEAEGIRGEFRGTLQDAGIRVNGAYHVPFLNDPGAPFNIWSNFRHTTKPPNPNEGVFYVRGNSLKVGPGLRLVWRTAGQ